MDRDIKAYIMLKAMEKVPAGLWKDEGHHYTLDQISKWTGNVGFVCGTNDICVLDIDAPERVDALGIKPYVTRAVKTGSGGFHLYYRIPNAKKVILNDLEGIHLGELQCMGQYVVCPPSIHPNGNPYVWLNDLPITQLASVEEVLKPFEGKIKTYMATKTSPASRPTAYGDPLSHVNVEDIWDAKVTGYSGDQMLCEHPVHGSTTGHNLIINPEKNVWQCRRCMSGGGPALAIAVKYGILRCDEARSGALRGFKYIEVLDKAREVGFIKELKVVNKPGGLKIE